MFDFTKISPLSDKELGSTFWSPTTMTGARGKIARPVARPYKKTAWFRSALSLVTACSLFFSAWGTASAQTHAAHKSLPKHAPHTQSTTYAAPTQSELVTLQLALKRTEERVAEEKALRQALEDVNARAQARLIRQKTAPNKAEDNDTASSVSQFHASLDDHLRAIVNDSLAGAKAIVTAKTVKTGKTVARAKPKWTTQIAIGALMIQDSAKDFFAHSVAKKHKQRHPVQNVFTTPKGRVRVVSYPVSNHN